MDSRITCRAIGFLAIAAPAFALFGCSPPATTVSGKVLIEGKPVTGGQISFIDKTGMPYTANIDPDGSYTRTGVPLGEMTVLVVGPRPPVSVPAGRDDVAKKLSSGNDSQSAAAAANSPPVPRKYGDPNTSDLRYTVTAGPNSYNPPLK